MLIEVKNLTPDKKREFMDLVNIYKTDGRLRQTLLYSCHKDHLMSSTKHDDYDELVSTRDETLYKFKYYDYVSMLDDEILGVLYFSTSERDGVVYGHEMFVWRVADKASFTFGKDLNAIKDLYEDSCHECNELVIQTDSTRRYEQKFGSALLRKYPDAKFHVEKVRCRDGKYRLKLHCVRKGNL